MPADTPATSTAPWQARPVFISSTFADMQAERSHLATHVFPRLEELLRSRRHQFEPIDLRLGVDIVALPDEHARELQVLKVCLEEIERSRPFLIVLLGDRYGWVPAPERMQTAARERGFSTDLHGKSITALEIEFGLMKKDAQQRQRSFIYLRDPLPYAQMPPELAAAYSDAFASDDGAVHRVNQLQALKARLHADPELQSRIHPYQADWDSKAQHVTGLDAWGEQVFQHLWAELDTETQAWASAAPQTWQQQERAALQEFVDQRRRDFIGREALLGQLLGMVHAPAAADGQQPGTPWGACVTGGSGAGKSALMAELCARLGNEPGLLVLANAAGATAQGADPDAMLRRFIDDLAGALGTQSPLPDNAKPDEVEATFASLLGQVSQRQRVVLLLDALNQFDPTPRGQQLTWLRTKHWPANARLIATTLPDAPGAAVLGQAQGVVTVALPALAEHDVDELARRVWARYHRSINPEVVQALKAKQLPNGQPAAGNPLWLTLALEQLNLLDADDFERAQKSYPGRTPAEKLHALLLDTVKQMPPDVPGLYGALLEYTERAYGQPQARAFAVLIALGRFGWRETDLLPLVPVVAGLLFPGQETAKLDDLGLAVLRRGFRAHLVRRGAAGQLDFFHVQMREAVQRRALGNAALVKRCHLAIADHLQGLPVGDPLRDPELMVHVIGADESLRAATLYADLPDPSAALDGATQALFRHLTQSTPEESEAALAWVAALPGQAGLENSKAANLCNRFTFDLSAALEDQATLHVRERMILCARDALERLARADPGNAGWQYNLSVSHNKFGDILRGQGDLGGALKALRAGMEIADRLARAAPGNAGLQHGLALSRGGFGKILQAQGDLAGALKAFGARLEIAERLASAEPGNAVWQRDLSVSHGEIGAILQAQGDLAGALKAFGARMEIAERLASADSGNADWQRDLSVSHIKIGDIQQAQGDLAGALKAFGASMEIAERLASADPGNAGWQRDLSVLHEMIGGILQAQGNLAGALKAYRVGHEIFERLVSRDPGNAGWQRDLSVSHEMIGGVLQAQGDLAGALKACRARHEIAVRLSRADSTNAAWQRDVCVSSLNMGDVLLAEGDVPGALAAFRKGLAIAEALVARHADDAVLQRDLSICHIKIGQALLTQHDQQGALKAFRTGIAIYEVPAARIQENTTWQRDLSAAYESVGDILRDQGDPDGALRALRKSLEIDERLTRTDPGNNQWQHDLLTSNIKMGDVLQAKGDLGSAHEAFRVALEIGERLTRVDPSHSQWQRDAALANSKTGDLLLANGDLPQAMVAFRKSHAAFEALATRNPTEPDRLRDLSLSHERIGDVLRAQGDLAAAREAFLKGLAVSEAVATLDPSSAAFQRDLVVSHTKLRNVAAEAGDTARAHWHLAHCAHVLHSMRRAGMHLDASLSRLLARLETDGISEHDAGGHEPQSGGTHPQVQSPARTPFGAAALPKVSVPQESTSTARATRMNLEYQQALARWRAMSWLQRLRTKKPEPPSGI